MYKLLGDNFRFVATFPRDLKELKGGRDYSNRPYCVLAAESDEAVCEAIWNGRRNVRPQTNWRLRCRSVG